MNKSKNIKDELREWLKNAERIVVIGIGNELRGDDSVGVRIVRSLKGKVPKHVMLIESETVPESFIELITEFNPTNILLIDAGLVGLKPGDARLVESCEVLGPLTAPVSTHALPLRIFFEYLKKTINAKIVLLIIQPKRTDFGEGLSCKVEESVRKLRTILLEILGSS